jgi:hypothetical protein
MPQNRGLQTEKHMGSNKSRGGLSPEVPLHTSRLDMLKRNTIASKLLTEMSLPKED